MSNLELPEQHEDLPEARIMWAASFLMDWLIPVLHDERIDTPEEVIELREKFPQLPPEEFKGADFSINDVLEAALRWRSHNQTLNPDVPEEKLPSGKELRKAIELLREAVRMPPESNE